ncbi:MAG: hypothetical protein PHU25_18580 [Deltaproteobacteria bacterium]|nr:hypothetical protein [Deltaproteobacteria bacterium]
MHKRHTRAALVLLLVAIPSGITGCWPFAVEDDDDDIVYDAGDTGGDNPCVAYGYVSRGVVEGVDDITRLAGCTYIEGDLVIEGTSLESLAGLEGLHAIGGSLVVRDNPSLASLVGLDGLVQVDRGVTVERNPLLGDLAALAWLMDVGGDLRIEGNLGLASVEGLFGMVRLGGSLLSVTDNPVLSTCDAEDLVEALEAKGFSGTVEIWGNKNVGPCEDVDGGIEAGEDAGGDV